MAPERSETVEALFHAALKLEPGRRGAYLEEACGGDRALMEEVASLLAVHGEAADFLEPPAWERFLCAEGEEEHGPEEGRDGPDLPFERLGAFRLVRRLGEGGMGVVYLAVQEPPGREVALKVLRPERKGSQEAETRFLREVEAVAELRHPNIAALFGSGEERGVCYFAMELIPGRGLDEILRQARAAAERVKLPEVLRWVKEIASALDAAHEMGIIHRDVKPSNIRITPEGRAVLMDFGIARHLDLSTLTVTGAFRGTPHYASPEQVKGGRHAIDARTDVYSLGVTLYEAATGRIPFEGETTEQVFRQILDKEPVPPRRLNPLISRDLETVIMTAMEKEPARRYAKMAEFGSDIERMMAGEMIRARPAGPVTRLLKRVRRYPIVSGAVGVAALALLALVIYILWSYPLMIQERNEAERRRREAIQARDEAEREAEKVRAVNRFLEGMLRSPDPGKDGREVRVVEVLDQAVRDLAESLGDQPAIEATVRHMLGMTYRSLGLYREAEEQARRAVEISTRVSGGNHPDTLASLNNLANVLHEEGRFDEAEALHRKTLEVKRGVLGEGHPDTLISMHNLANVLQDMGRFDAAELLYREVLLRRREVLGPEHPETLTTLNNLAAQLQEQGRFAEAEPLHRDALEVKRRTLGEAHPSTLVSMHNLAVLLKNQGKVDEAEALLREVLSSGLPALGGEHPRILSSMYTLALVLKEQGRLEDAGDLLREVVKIRERTLGERHPQTLSAEVALANLLKELDRHAEADVLYVRVIGIAERVLPADHPDLAIYRLNYGECLMRLGRSDDAEKHLVSSFEGFRAALGADHPYTRSAARLLVELYESLGEVEKADAYRDGG